MAESYRDIREYEQVKILDIRLPEIPDMVPDWNIEVLVDEFGINDEHVGIFSKVPDEVLAKFERHPEMQQAPYGQHVYRRPFEYREEDNTNFVKTMVSGHRKTWVRAFNWADYVRGILDDSKMIKHYMLFLMRNQKEIIEPEALLPQWQRGRMSMYEIPDRKGFYIDLLGDSLGKGVENIQLYNEGECKKSGDMTTGPLCTIAKIIYEPMKKIIQQDESNSELDVDEKKDKRRKAEELAAIINEGKEE